MKRKFSVVWDDDHGEASDVIGKAEEDDHVAVELLPCKFAVADKPGARIKELCELCGHAQTSIRWREKPMDLFTHLLRRELRHYKGTEGTVEELLYLHSGKTPFSMRYFL